MSQQEAQALIAAAIEKYVEAYNRGDAMELAGFYTEQAQLLLPGSDAIVGRSAIQSFWERRLSPEARSITLASLEVEVFQDTAVEVGAYSIHGPEGQLLDRGKYVVVWKFEQGDWKLHRDILNTSLQQR
jgi:uncharacterized protein (TIGR02246 family)